MKILAPEVLLRAYAMGIFPMSDSHTDHEVRWYEPTLRGIIPLDGFRVSQNVLRLMRNQPHELRIDHDFEGTVRACAQRDETWISETIVASYTRLYTLGYAHSVEIWQGQARLAGLYGVALQGAFFGESMFQTQPEWHKVALAYCHERLVTRGYRLWDTQFYTPHLGTFGATEISQEDYLELLKHALKVECRFGEEGIHS